jgi:hypothetical protein
MNREILLEMYEKLWNADKDKWAWNVILKDTLEKMDVIQQDPNEALMKAAEKYKEETFNTKRS